MPRSATHGARLLLALLLQFAPASAEEPPEPSDAWCAPEVEALRETVCAYAPETPDAAAPKTLVLFLHSLVGNTGSFRWQQQRLMRRMADAHGFVALMPKGRPGFGPGRDPNVVAWPTARELQEKHEDVLISEWMEAKEVLEKRLGAFQRVLVFGFSNGAYYAASLALRGRLEVDGYGVFAGGSGGKYSKLLASRAPRRVPIFVGYGTKDPDHPRQRSLIRTLSDVGWPHRSKADAIGHTVSNAQIRSALSFLRAENQD